MTQKKKNLNNVFIHQKYKGKMVECSYKITQYNNETSMSYNHTSKYGWTSSHITQDKKASDRCVHAV